MFEDFSQPVDLYCERLSPAFWAEPVNALSNLAFILGAVFAYMLYRRSGTKSKEVVALIIMLLIVGIGSFIFHTVATKGAVMADVLPIVVFIVYAIYVIFTRVFKLKWYYSITCVMVFAALNALILNAFGRNLFNGSIMYVPTFIFLLLVSLYAAVKHYPPSREFLYAAVVFLVSLTCRSIDNQVCAQFPLGTHFLWHILNGITMYYVIKGLIKTVRNNTLIQP